jgi:2-C-methyl-D-erythritol 4-phosphate cytidylyltransferase/2-C-methyl-D-erythritol 2,4-cyclodiphosphate synthase
MGSGKPKQYALLRGIPVIVHTLSKFESSASIRDVVLVVPPDDLDRAEELVRRYGCGKVKSVLPGGAERQDSVRRGLGAVPPDAEIVLVHDGARPFISPAEIDRCVSAAREDGAVSLGIPVRDTVKRVEAEGRVMLTLEREGLWLTQTPQAFRRDLIEEAYRKAYEEGFYGTDDAGLVERIGFRVRMIAGSPDNIKLTTPEDLAWGEVLLRKEEEMKVGMGYDSHRIEPGRPMILGGVEIPSERGPAGHSDADVLLHAVMDAIFGAMGAGDLGTHFPDTDPAYKGISSMALLGRTHDEMRRKGFALSHVDATVILERPKIMPFVEEMTGNIARCLEVSPACVSIKAKTNEGMGFIGRQEGIAAMAVAMLRKDPGRR